MGAWIFDRRISMTLLLAVGVQTAGIVYFVGQATARLSQVETSAERASSRVADLEQGRALLSERIARAETNVVDMFDLLRRMDAKLDRLQEYRGR